MTRAFKDYGSFIKKWKRARVPLASIILEWVLPSSCMCAFKRTKRQSFREFGCLWSMINEVSMKLKPVSSITIRSCFIEWPIMIILEGSRSSLKCYLTSVKVGASMSYSSVIPWIATMRCNLRGLPSSSLWFISVSRMISPISLTMVILQGILKLVSMHASYSESRATNWVTLP